MPNAADPGGRGGEGGKDWPKGRVARRTAARGGREAKTAPPEKIFGPKTSMKSGFFERAEKNLEKKC